MRVCEWCGVLRANATGELCEDCELVLAPKSQAFNAHSKLDEHVDSCVVCRHCAKNFTLGGKPCTEGSRLHAEAIALDGRLDAEYAAVFGSVDPIDWFRRFV